MNTYPRRDFLNSLAALFALSVGGASFKSARYQPLLSFSTLGCPDWSFEKILSFAKENGYSGIEIRGVKRELDLPKCPEFSSQKNISSTRKLVNDNGVKIVNLGASSHLHQGNPAERKKNIDEAKRFIDLAAELQCPFVRVFPNNFPKDQERAATIDLIVKGLMELGDYSKGTKVTVLMETHGEVVQCNDLETIMKQAAHQHVGLIWDIVNMWAVTKEKPADVYPRLKKYIRHTHIKDLRFVNGKDEYTLLGKGESPVFEAIDLLANDAYKGYYSFEWEKLWHPEIADPEIALADFPRVMGQHFKTV